MNKLAKLMIVVLAAIVSISWTNAAPAAEPDWKLGTQAYSFKEFTFFEAVDKTASLGLKYIEAYPGQKFSPDKLDKVFVHTMDAELRKLAKDKLAAAGVKLVNYGVVGLDKDEAKSREVFDFAKDMGIETIVSEPKTEALDTVEKLCKEYNIKVAIHNHPKPSFYWDCDTVLAAVKDRTPLMGASADTGHWMRSGLDPLACLKKLEGRIISLHFKDLNEFGVRQAHDVVWGTGKADAKVLLAELKRQNFKGVFSIEYEFNWKDSLPEIKASVEFFNKTAAELSGGAAAAAPAAAGSLDIAALEAALTKAAKYDYGQDRTPLSDISDIIKANYASSANLKSIEKRFLEFLRSDATIASKQFICRQLSIIGTADSVDTLSAMLADATTMDMALYALERIPGDAADDAIGKALSKTTGRAKAGIINTLGVRRVQKSVPALAELVSGEDAMIASSAAAALGKIANKEALDALSKAKDKTTGAVKQQVLDAYLNAAGTLGEAGLPIFQELSAASQPLPIRIAAVRKIAAINGDKASDMVLGLLADPAMESTAIILAKEMPGEQTIKAMTEKMASLSSAGKVQLLAALADRKVPGVLPVVKQAVSSDDQAVRIAALIALKDLGDESTIALLANNAATTTGDEQAAARSSLYKLRGAEIDKNILASIEKAQPSVKLELVTAIGERNIKGSTATLLTTAEDADAKVRMESIKVIKVVANEKDLPAMMNLLVKGPKDAERAELERTVAVVASKMADGTGKAKAVLAALTPEYDKQNAAAKASVLSILSKIGDDSSLPMVVAALKDSDAAVREAAVRALADWPTAAPADEVLKIARESDNEVFRILALRGYVRQLGLVTGRSNEETLAKYKEAMALAPNAAEKKAVFAGIANLRNLASLLMAQEYLADETLGQEAQSAMLRIVNTTRRTNPAETKAALEKLLATPSATEESRTQAKRVLDRLN